MLELQHVFKDYFVDKKPIKVLKDINLTFEDSGFIAILGPSGCGKTTLLNLIGGLDQYTSGDLLVDGKSTKTFNDKDWDAYRNSRVGFVFQSYNLIPHLTVLENVELSLILVGENAKERKEKASRALILVGLESEMYKKPNQLSGGQMQRVAIARAMVNDPKIILADEPTGALDSKTSVVVMDLLKEIARTKLVLMVTHNNDLANKYATRIISLKDGVVTDDSSPLAVSDKESTIKEINQKTNMSFWMALKLSFKNVLTKKGRTILTATAASFGIIGVALVLAISNGLNEYIHNVEVATASSIPISIGSTSTTTTVTESNTFEKYPETSEVYVYSSTSTTTYNRNNFTQEYEQYVRKLVDDGLASSVLVNNDGFDLNVVTKRQKDGEDDYIKVNTYKSASSSVSSSFGSLLSLPSTIFHEFYGEEEYISSLYDIIDGTYPEGANEVALIVDRYNRVNVSYLKELGLVGVETAGSGDVVADPDVNSIPFDQILGKEYKVFPSEEFYEEAATKTVSDYKITGFNEETGEISGEEITKDIKFYSDPSSDSTKLKSLYDDEDKGITVKITAILRPAPQTLLELMPTSIGYNRALREELLSKVHETAKDDENIQNAIGIAKEAEQAYSIKSIDGLEELYNYVLDLSSNLSSIGSSIATEVSSKISGAFTFYKLKSGTNTSSFSNIGDVLYQSGNFFEQSHAFGALFNRDSDTDATSPNPTGDYILRILMYALGYSNVTSITIFPASLNAKEQIKAYLEEWNNNPNNNTIKYTDYVETITTNIATMINAVSIILIAFASISLVVSCVMTGIITYTSVIERTKEIGILRALGARKKDVGRLFEAESVIVGFVSGLIGVIVAYVLTYPINAIINSLYPDQGLDNLANLNGYHAIILIAISIVLTFISGLIPSRTASKKNPVEALRTE